MFPGSGSGASAWALTSASPLSGSRSSARSCLKTMRKRLVEILGHRIERQDAGLHDLAAQPALDHDPATRPAIDRHPGRKGRQAEEAEALGQRRPLAVAGRDLQGRAAGPHAVEVDDPLDLRFLFYFQ